MGEKFVENFFQKTIDKIAVMWYNREFGAFTPANAPMKKKRGAVIPHLYLIP